MTELITWTHIIAGTLAVLMGAVALMVTKGHHLHRFAGKVFIITMLLTAMAGIVMAVSSSDPITMMAGLLTIYLVTTGWQAVRPGMTASSRLQYTAMFGSISIAASLGLFGFVALTETSGTWRDYAAADYFFLATIAALGSTGDLAQIMRNGYKRKARIARHVWRMCTGLFFAVGSLFTGPGATAFPQTVRDSGLLVMPELIVFLSMIVWLALVAGGWWKRKPISNTTP